jgi:hypothetical protein
MKKKVKKYAGGGLSGIASEATSLMGAADTAANAINSIKDGSGVQGPIGGSGALGFLNNSNQSGPQPAYDPKAQAQALRSGKSGNPDMYNQIITQQKNFADYTKKMLAGMNNPTQFKKGGKVSSASKRADGIAIRGKTRA